MKSAYACLLSDLDDCPRLSNEQHADLLHNGGDHGRQQCILSVLPWAVQRASKRTPYKNTDRHEVTCRAIHGAIEGIDHWIPEKGTLITYVTYWIDKRINEYFREEHTAPKTSDSLDETANAPPEESSLQKDQCARLRAAMSLLTDRQQRVMRRRLMGESLAEIGTFYKLCPSTVHAIERKAISDLKKILSTEQETP